MLSGFSKAFLRLIYDSGVACHVSALTLVPQSSFAFRRATAHFWFLMGVSGPSVSSPSSAAAAPATVAPATLPYTGYLPPVQQTAPSGSLSLTLVVVIGELRRLQTVSGSGDVQSSCSGLSCLPFCVFGCLWRLAEPL